MLQTVAQAMRDGVLRQDDVLEVTLASLRRPTLVCKRTGCGHSFTVHRVQ